MYLNCLFSDIDVLINNAGIRTKHFNNKLVYRNDESFTYDESVKMININYYSTLKVFNILKLLDYKEIVSNNEF